MSTVVTRMLSLATALALSCGASRHGDAPAVFAEAARNDPRGRPFVIGVSDVVRVTVWKDPNLSAESSVLPDGTITLPLVGAVPAAGVTAADLRTAVAEKLATFTKDPVVTVTVIEVNSYRFTVAGNVEHPGLFTSKSYLTVSQAIALAGGPNRYADTRNVVVVRNGRRISIDYDEILSGRSPEQDIVVLAGDAVQVP
jgi:polysaccharide biosynthesis/export protein